MSLSKNACWWTREPDLYKSELEAFEQRGAKFEVVFEKNGHLILAVDWPFDGGEIKIAVGYSPFHPKFPPSVKAPQLRERFPKHVNPEGGLCLLEDQNDWAAFETVAHLLDVQLPAIAYANDLRSSGQMEGLDAVEAAAPDPLSAYFNGVSKKNCAVFLPGQRMLPIAAADFVIWTFMKTLRVSSDWALKK